MKVKELIEELKQYDENGEIQISIDNKTESDIQIGKDNGTIVISESDKIKLKKLQKEISDLKFEVELNKNASYLNLSTSFYRI